MRVVPLEPTVPVADSLLFEKPVPAPLFRVRDDPPDTTRDLNRRQFALRLQELVDVGQDRLGIGCSTLVLEQPGHGETASMVRLPRTRWAVQDHLALPFECFSDVPQERIDRGWRNLGGLLTNDGVSRAPQARVRQSRAPTGSAAG